MNDPEPDPLADLLDLARAAVMAAVEGRRAPTPDSAMHSVMEGPADAFVTLTEDGDLRGCMGTLGANLPLGEAVVRAARLAATRDPRFWPVNAGEVAHLHVEVSVLGRPRRLADVADYVPGRDGIIVERHGYRALLLPQVAIEMGWGTTEMLRAACEKAGLHPDAWREPATSLNVFEVVRTGGPLIPAVMTTPV